MKQFALIVVLAVCVVAVSAAFGQPGGPQPPTPTKADTPPVVMNYICLLVIVAMAIGANLIPSKRGHQD
ncbi:MAG: hypothetical protein KIS87_13375 [Phycisphaeraceae bacterium]|nr:hypothetical protein [Phycisphaeraceae bacterium]